MDNIGEKWDEIKQRIMEEFSVTRVSFDTWIKPLVFDGVKDDVIYIIVPDDLVPTISYISQKYSNFFNVTVSEMFDHNYTVNFITKKDSVITAEEKKEAPSVNENVASKLNLESSNLDSKYTFDTFVVGSNNKFAHSASLAVAETPGKVYNPLFLYGGPGLGKTHLMHSIGRYILEHNPNKKVLYVTSEDFVNEIIDSIRNGNDVTMKKFRDKYRNVDVLMVDDVQFIIGKTVSEEEFFHTFNSLHSNKKQIIISSDKPPKEMNNLDERFISRFEWGLVASIQPPDYETKIAILKNNAEKYDREISDDIINYIATNIKSNIRELEGALNKIIMFSRLNKVELTLDLAKEALKDVIYPNKPKEITPQLIINVVAEHYNIKPTDITSSKKNSEFARPRQIVMYLSKKMTSYTLKEIGKALGGKDHSTILHGANKVESDLKNDTELNNNVDIIVKKLNPV